ncbi:MAG: hypothetical protein ACRC5H_03325 [Treponemataceae bacterium]
MDKRIAKVAVAAQVMGFLANYISFDRETKKVKKTYNRESYIVLMTEDEKNAFKKSCKKRIPRSKRKKGFIK